MNIQEEGNGVWCTASSLSQSFISTFKPYLTSFRAWKAHTLFCLYIFTSDPIPVHWLHLALRAHLVVTFSLGSHHTLFLSYFLPYHNAHCSLFYLIFYFIGWVLNSLRVETIFFPCLVQEWWKKESENKRRRKGKRCRVTVRVGEKIVDHSAKSCVCFFCFVCFFTE